MNARRLPPDNVKQAGVLSDYAVAARYPGLTEPVTYEEYDKAVAIAERAVLWVENIFKEKLS